MLSRLLLASAFFVVATIPVAAQGQDSGGGAARMLMVFEQFVDRLRIDAKTQLPSVVQLFNEAVREASPVEQELLGLREKLVQLELENPAGLKPVLDAYTAAAVKMTRIETQLFARVYALLQPNQQSRARQAFEQLAGVFQLSPGGGDGGRGGRGGRGGGQ